MDKFILRSCQLVQFIFSNVLFPKRGKQSNMYSIFNFKLGIGIAIVHFLVLKCTKCYVQYLECQTMNAQETIKV